LHERELRQHALELREAACGGTVIDGPGGEKLSNRRAAALAGVSHHLVHLVRRERAIERAGEDLNGR
jgi:hypothetical protein